MLIIITNVITQYSLALFHHQMGPLYIPITHSTVEASLKATTSTDEFEL
jgi:hypothetical protein